MCRGKGGNRGGGGGGGGGGARRSTIHVATRRVEHTCCWNILHARMETFTDDEM